MKGRQQHRRDFLQQMAGPAGGTLVLSGGRLEDTETRARNYTAAELAVLPSGPEPEPLPLAHFPSRLHAFVWRNWPLVPAERLARTVGVRTGEIRELARRMGLAAQPPITPDRMRRSTITVLKRNWHLLPYGQLLTLLDCTPQELAFTLREDDFLYIKLGSRKPRCAPLAYTAPGEAERRREAEIAAWVRGNFPGGLPEEREPLFSFVRELSAPPAADQPRRPAGESLRFCYSYFALYGDPLLETHIDPYPDGLLARLAETGVNGVWLQGVLHNLARCPWHPIRSQNYQERRKNLQRLASRAARFGIGIFLYLNEPRALPLSFFRKFPELKGLTEGDYAALCTSVPAVQDYLRESVAAICRAVPELGGFFTITASENLTSCWSHGKGQECPRCSRLSPAAVIAGVNRQVAGGIGQAGGKQRLLAWDWGWQDAWAEEAIRLLPDQAALMSVSEWSLPIERGGIRSTVGEYSISSVGPGPRARRHWKAARARGLKVLAKIQAGNTWELSALPYIPVPTLVEEHIRNLLREGVDGYMLGWTLGGYPSPNLETVGELIGGGSLASIARRRFGEALAPAVLKAWQACGAAFREFPYSGQVVYQAPLQCGPSNLLWAEPTGYRSTMVGFPYDDLDGWRGIYPADVFIAQLEKTAAGFSSAARTLQQELSRSPQPGDKTRRREAEREGRLMQAAGLHWGSAAAQCRFTQERRRLSTAASAAEAEALLRELERILLAETESARELYRLQEEDSRLGFEASNQYYYVPMDLAEKMLNCLDLRTRWLPAQRRVAGRAS